MTSDNVFPPSYVILSYIEIGMIVIELNNNVSKYAKQYTTTT